MTEQSDRRLEVDAEGRQVAVHHEAGSTRELFVRLFWEIATEFGAAFEEAAFLRLDDRFFSLPRELSPKRINNISLSRMQAKSGCW